MKTTEALNAALEFVEELERELTLSSSLELKRARLEQQLVQALSAPPSRAPITWPKTRDVGRFGDMSPADHLRVGLDSDNDVYVSVWGDDGGASVEFCNPGGGGGGSSRRTREALIALMVAMEADNAERPEKDWWARRNNINAHPEPN